jgi:hypothetical protein
LDWDKAEWPTTRQQARIMDVRIGINVRVNFLAIYPGKSPFIIGFLVLIRLSGWDGRALLKRADMEYSLT